MPIYFGSNIDSGKVTYEGKEYSRRIQLENLMKRQLAALVHCVRRTALMRFTDMTGTMTKRITGGIINASIILKKYALPQ